MKKVFLGKIAEISVGNPIARYKYNENKAEKKFKYELFSQSMLSDSAILRKSSTEKFFADKDLSYSCTQEKDIIYGLRSPNQAVFITKENQGLLVQSYMAIIRCNIDIILPEYLALKLNSTDIKKQIHKNIQGGFIQLLKIQNVKDLVIKPPSLDEQQKIVEIMKTGYSEIQVLKQIIEQKEKILKSII